MTLPSRITSAPARATARRLRLAAMNGLAVLGTLLVVGDALAQGSSPAGSIGAQLNLMSGEALDSGGTLGGALMYLMALITFLGGAWAFWKSRQPQNREGGYVGMGLAGLVLCGLFAAGGTWINKASMTTSGAVASVSNAPAAVRFQ